MKLSTVYLLFYNVAQCVGWSAILVKMTTYYAEKKTHVGMYKEVQQLLNIFQTAAIFEIVHAALGLVRSNPLLTGFQVMSRVFVTWQVYAVTEVHNTVGAPLFLLAWSITEVVRYSFYAFGLLGSTPYFITWCRYTLFIILYPIGVTGELISSYYSLPYVKRTGMWSLAMPNKANMAFNYYYVLHAIMFLYIPIFPQLYMHMFKQRSKIIGGAGSSKKVQ